MNRRCLPWLALLAMLPLGTGGILAQTVWQTVTDPDGAFTIEMPGQPKHWTDERKSPRGATLMLHNYAVGYNGQIFAIGTAQGSQELDLSQPRVNLQQTLTSMATRLASGRWDEVVWLQYQGVDAVEAIGVTKENLAYRGFLVLKDRQSYSLAFSGPADRLRSPDADRFFKSLRLR
jgi:hypothetical protein